MRVICDGCGNEIDENDRVMAEINYTFRHYKDGGITQDYRVCLCLECGADVKSAIQNILGEQLVCKPKETKA